jgi:hypothetical protein
VLPNQNLAVLRADSCTGARRGERLFVSRVSGACFGIGAWHKHRYNILREAQPRVFSLMPTEVSIPDAEDLKSRVRELRRFL